MDVLYPFAGALYAVAITSVLLGAAISAWVGLIVAGALAVVLAIAWRTK